MHADRVQPLNYKLWKEYRSGPDWRGDPLQFKRWLASREKRREIDWGRGRGEEIQRATLEIDGFRVVVKVEYDSISKLDDCDSFGSYDDGREDHYAIDRLQGDAEPRRSRDSRKRYYNEPRHGRYEEQRCGWLEVRKPKTVATTLALGRKLSTDLNGFEKGRQLTDADVKSLVEAKYIAVPVEGRLVRRCRYNKYDGTNTRSKSEDDLHVRRNIVKAKEIVDGWYEDQWYYLDVSADAYMGDVELGSASCMGIDSVDEDHLDEMAMEIAEEAAREARKKFDEIRGTADTRCELIGEIYAAAVDGEDESLDAWLGFLYAAIATGTVLDLEDASSSLDEFFMEHPELAKRTRLYVNRYEDE